MVRRVTLGLLCLFLSPLAAPRLAPALPIVTAGSATVTVGDTFTIPISITGAVDLTFWQFDLAFNPALLQAVAVTEGPFMSSFGATLFIPPLVIDNTAGLISGMADAYVGLPPDPNGSGDLADIQFQAIASGVSPLTLQGVYLNLLDPTSGTFDLADGQVTVNTPVPEPSTLTLLSLGLGAWGLRRWARSPRR